MHWTYAPSQYAPSAGIQVSVRALCFLGTYCCVKQSKFPAEHLLTRGDQGLRVIHPQRICTRAKYHENGFQVRDEPLYLHDEQLSHP